MTIDELKRQLLEDPIDNPAELALRSIIKALIEESGCTIEHLTNLMDEEQMARWPDIEAAIIVQFRTLITSQKYPAEFLAPWEQPEFRTAISQASSFWRDVNDMIQAVVVSMLRQITGGRPPRARGRVV